MYVMATEAPIAAAKLITTVSGSTKTAPTTALTKKKSSISVSVKVTRTYSARSSMEAMIMDQAAVATIEVSPNFSNITKLVENID